MYLTGKEKTLLFAKIFKQELLREFQFLWDAKAGRAVRKGTFTDMLLSAVSPVKSVLEALPVIGTVVSTVALDPVLWAMQTYHDKQVEKRIGHIGSLYDAVDLVAFEIVADKVAREIALRYEHFILVRLTDVPEDGVVPFAQVGVARVLEYIARKGLPLSEENLIQGLMEGRSGAGVEGFFNTQLPGKNRYAKEKFEAEAVYARSGFRTIDGQRWIRERRVVRSDIPKWTGYTEFRHKQFLPQFGRKSSFAFDNPIGGFVLVPFSVVKHYDFLLDNRGPDYLEQELNGDLSGNVFIDADTVRAYALQLRAPTNIPRLLEYIEQQTLPKRHIEQVTCHDDLRGIALSNADLSDCDFSGSIFSGDLTNISFQRSYLIGAHFEERTILHNAQFQQAHCEYLEATLVDFYGSNFSQAIFSFAKLDHSIIKDCVFLGSFWHNVNLTGIETDQALAEEHAKQLQQLHANNATQTAKIAHLNDKLEQQRLNIQRIQEIFLEQVNSLSAQVSPDAPAIKNLRVAVEQLVRAQSHREIFERYCVQEFEQVHSQIAGSLQQTSINQEEILCLQDRMNQMQKMLEAKSLAQKLDISGELETIVVNFPELKNNCELVNAAFFDFKKEVLIVTDASDKRISALQDDLLSFQEMVASQILIIEHDIGKIKFSLAQIQREKLDNKPENKLPLKIAQWRERILEDDSLKNVLAMYIPTRAAINIHDATSFDLEQKVFEFFRSDALLLLILGSSGGGKSTFNYFLLRKMWENYKPGDAIPLLISLPNLENQKTNLLNEYFSTEGFTSEEIEVLKRDYQFNLLLDAYDEMNKHINLYVTNHLELWQIKILMSCRTQYLTSVADYQKLFIPYLHEKRLNERFLEVTVIPFSNIQVNAYIEKYIGLHREQEGIWLESYMYRDNIDNIPGLSELVATPFILSIALEVMPQIVSKYANMEVSERVRVTQTDLYDEFMENWFSRQESKLIIAGDLPDDGHDVKEDYLEFSMMLALAMHKEGLSQVKFISKSSLFGSKQPNQWGMFFGNNDPSMTRARKGCPLKQVAQNQWAFMHLSLMEYFVARAIYANEMDDQNNGTSDIGFRR